MTTAGNLTALSDLSDAWIDRIHERKRPKAIVLDMQSSESPTHGEQEGSAYNGHFGCTCYHPLFCFNQFVNLERCALRPLASHLPPKNLLTFPRELRSTTLFLSKWPSLEVSAQDDWSGVWKTSDQMCELLHMP